MAKNVYGDDGKGDEMEGEEKMDTISKFWSKQSMYILVITT